MSTHQTNTIDARYLERRAVIYIRQSSPRQVRVNQESQHLQRDMRQHALRLGWRDDQIDEIDADTARSAATADGRDAYKKLLADVAMGLIGAVFSYESGRLSRNCSDWYPLLDICAFADCLIVDRDGVYEPWTPNGRLFLGMKGIISEVELHTLQGRLIAGARNKASRGELAHPLPVGLIRLEDGHVVKNPDIQVQEAISLVFGAFLELGSVTRVVRRFSEQNIRIPRRFRNSETVWRRADSSTVWTTLTNPAYAGAFVHGRSRTVRRKDSRQQSRIRVPMNEWEFLIKDHYPAYINWETYEKIQLALQDNYADYKRRMTCGTPRQGDALLQGIAYCGECGHKMCIRYTKSAHYICEYLRKTRGMPVCQTISVKPVDDCVADAFLEAIRPVELDLYEDLVRLQQKRHAETEKAWERQLRRLRYEVELSRRQYDRVDPDNRLVAAELERRWESALRNLQQEEARVQRERHREANGPSVSDDLRSAFRNLGEALPELWEAGKIAAQQRKRFLRCLIDKVAMQRVGKTEIVRLRIVWRGGQVTETNARLRVGSLGALSTGDEMASIMRRQLKQGKSDVEIAAYLTAQGFHSSKRPTVPKHTVQRFRLAQGMRRRQGCTRLTAIPGRLTVAQVATRLDVSTQWIYDCIGDGRIKIARDPEMGLYLFPDRRKTLVDLRRLRERRVSEIIYRGAST